METLKNLNARRLYQEFLMMSEADFLTFLSEIGVFWSVDKRRPCTNSDCDGSMKYSSERQSWRCRKRECDKEAGLRTGTFFEGAHLSFREIFQLSYLWCRETHSITEFQHDLRRDDGSTISTKTLTDWRQFFRDVCSTYLLANPDFDLGGINDDFTSKIVEIDETVLSRRKYNRGKMVTEAQWIFGGVERDGSKCFLEVVERRDAATLLPIIQRYIAPGSLIVSDCWAAYWTIDQLKEGYLHDTVNHSYDFVDPATLACTNKCEGMWSNFKQKVVKNPHGVDRDMLPSYMDEFMWRKKFGGPDIVFHFWSHVREQFPCRQD